MLKRWAMMLLTGTILAGAALGAVAEPQEQMDFTDLIEDIKRSQESMLDDYFNSHGPFRHDPALLDFYIGSDPRFAEFIDRMIVRKLADPDEQADYVEAVAKGRFEGSAEDYARFRTASWLSEPRYGYYAQIHSPPNIPNAYALLEDWHSADMSGPLAKEAPCATRWTERASLAELAKEFGQATDMYLAWAKADGAAAAGFNPEGVQFMDAASETAFLRAAITRWLLAGDQHLLHRGNCVMTSTNFDVWASWSAGELVSYDTFSSAYPPVEVKDGTVPPSTSSGD
jgi:hypothetical protein